MLVLDPLGLIVFIICMTCSMVLAIQNVESLSELFGLIGKSVPTVIGVAVVFGLMALLIWWSKCIVMDFFVTVVPHG